jgi:predicted PurR-regulated permease PerM
MATKEREKPKEEPNPFGPFPGQPGPDDTTFISKYLRGPHDLSTVALVGIFLLGFVFFLYFARPFLLPVVLAVILNFLLKPVVRFFGRFHIPQALGAVVVLAGFIGLISFGVSRLAQPAAEWAARAPESLREAERKVRHLLRPAEQLSRAAEHVEHFTAGDDAPKATRVEIKRFNLTDTVLSFTRSFLGGAIETLVLLYFLLASGDLFMQKLVKVMPTLQDKHEATEIAHEVQHNISTFLFTITVINTCLGVLVGVAMMIVGMPNPVLWGVLAGLLNFIPYFGPFTGVAVLLVVGLLTFERAGNAIVPPLIYISLHAIEANFITPMILGRRLVLNPVVIFASLIFWTWLWGIAGALLAVPLLMTLKILCEHFRPLAPFGEFLSG